MMPRFDVFAEAVLIGHSDLELGDAAMGVAEGKFIPSPAYASIEAECILARKTSQRHLCLSVRTTGGHDLPAQGGVHILDYSAEFGVEGFLVSVMGIGYPLYEELFPKHVAAYKAQFSK